MGQNLQKLEWIDPPAPAVKGAISPEDALNLKIFGFIWLGCIYGIAMIWWAMALLARWDRNRKTGFFSVVAAFVISSAWPVVMLYILANPV